MVSEGQEGLVRLGRIAGAYGIRGWMRVHSHTDPRENILDYSPWLLLLEGGGQREFALVEGRRHGKSVVVRLAGVEDRDAALALIGAEIAVDRTLLPPAGEGEYYWSDLMGLEVVTPAGVKLGRVHHLMETGANDVLVVRGERERLIPFIDQVVLEVDLDAGFIQADWDPEF